MPIPRGVARVNRSITNRITTPFARKLSGFGVVHHIGRTSGRTYETPINCWIDDRVVSVALTYGPEVDWLKNLESAEGGAIEVRGELLTIGSPRVVPTEEGLARMAPFVRHVLQSLKVTEFRQFEVLS